MILQRFLFILMILLPFTKLCVTYFHPLLHQVCLDGTVTTEKELDTVEVLKAIQKAKEVKDKKSGGDKKVRSVALMYKAGGRVRLVETV